MPSSRYTEEDDSDDNSSIDLSPDQSQRPLSIENLIIGQSNFKAQNPSNINLPEDRDIYRDSLRQSHMIRRKSSLPQQLGRILSKISNPMTLNTEPNELYLLKNSELVLFRDRAEWEANKSCQQYADLHYLILQGIPDEFRVRLWKDLLRTE